MSKLKFCLCCSQYEWEAEWDHLIGACSNCSWSNALGNKKCDHGESKPYQDRDWMRRDRHPPNPSKFPRLAAQLEAERRARKKAHESTS